MSDTINTFVSALYFQFDPGGVCTVSDVCQQTVGGDLLTTPLQT